MTMMTFKQHECVELHVLGGSEPFLLLPGWRYDSVLGVAVLTGFIRADAVLDSLSGQWGIRPVRYEDEQLTLGIDLPLSSILFLRQISDDRLPEFLRPTTADCEHGDRS